MNMIASIPTDYVFPDKLGPKEHRWLNQVFAAQAVKKGGIVRRKLEDVERQVGREVLLKEVFRRGYHAVICGGQFIIICNPGRLQVLI